MIRVSTNKRGISTASSNGLYLIVKLKARRFKHAYVTHVSEEQGDSGNVRLKRRWKSSGRVAITTTLAVWVIFVLQAFCYFLYLRRLLLICLRQTALMSFDCDCSRRDGATGRNLWRSEPNWTLTPAPATRRRGGRRTSWWWGRVTTSEQKANAPSETNRSEKQGGVFFFKHKFISYI